jgi:hypothetical protein
MTKSVSTAQLLWALVACFGCSTMLGIDGDYVPAALEGSSGGTVGAGDFPSFSGGAGPAGSGGFFSVGEGGTTAILDAGSGGSVSAGGSVAEAAACDPRACGSKQKCCPTLAPTCLDHAPIIGCSAESCDPCPAPPSHAIAICNPAGECAIACNDGYTQQGAACVANGTGGQGGAGGKPGAGGAGGAMCVAADCPPCNIAGPVKCCRNDGNCGCSWAATFVCY